MTDHRRFFAAASAVTAGGESRRGKEPGDGGPPGLERVQTTAIAVSHSIAPRTTRSCRLRGIFLTRRKLVLYFLGN